MFRQQFPALGLSLECGTDAVPTDGKYHLLVHGEVVKTFTSERSAMREYDALRKRLIAETGWRPEYTPPSREELWSRIRTEADAKAVQRESSQSKRANRTRKGGPGR